MNELIVQIYLPAFAVSYECRIKEELTIEKITELLLACVKEEMSFLSKSEISGCLFDKWDGKILDPSKTLKEYGYKTGDELMMI